MYNRNISIFEFYQRHNISIDQRFWWAMEPIHNGIIFTLSIICEFGHVLGSSQRVDLACDFLTSEVVGGVNTIVQFTRS